MRTYHVRQEMALTHRPTPLREEFDVRYKYAILLAILYLEKILPFGEKRKIINIMSYMAY